MSAYDFEGNDWDEITEGEKRAIVDRLVASRDALSEDYEALVAEHDICASVDPALRGALERADKDVSLVHDFLYGRGGTMDEAHAACWRIHEQLRPWIAALESETEHE